MVLDFSEYAISKVNSLFMVNFFLCDPFAILSMDLLPAGGKQQKSEVDYFFHFYHDPVLLPPPV